MACAHPKHWPKSFKIIPEAIQKNKRTAFNAVLIADKQCLDYSSGSQKHCNFNQRRHIGLSDSTLKCGHTVFPNNNVFNVCVLVGHFDLILESCKKIPIRILQGCLYIYIFTFTFTFLHLADAFIQSDLQCIQAIHFYCQYVCVHIYIYIYMCKIRNKIHSEIAIVKSTINYKETASNTINMTFWRRQTEI